MLQTKGAKLTDNGKKLFKGLEKKKDNCLQGIDWELHWKVVN